MMIRDTCRLVGAAVLVTVLPLLVADCDSGETVAPPPPPPPGPVTASDWINSVNWDQATTVRLDMREDGTSFTFSPAALTFEAGKPYILRIVSPPSNGENHYFATEGSSDFFQAIATRKIQTSQAEYKAPHFEAVELLIGGTLEIFFVPVLPGTYDFLCTITGHKQAGMFGKITITGGAGNRLDLEVAADFDRSLATDARKSGAHEVWSSRVDTRMAFVEQPSYGFDPTDLPLTRGVGYRIDLDNTSPDNVAKHYYTAPEFYRTIVLRKAQDSQAEIKALYLMAVELLVGGKTELFVVPTVAGTFQSQCTLPSHAEQGMKGTIVVSP